MEILTAGDDELWTAALSGDGKAFGQLFARHRDRLFRAALRSVPTAVDAEDAVATAFLELWRRRKDVSLVEGSVLPWLLATTHNVTRNFTRHQRRYRTFLQRLPEDRAAPSAEEVTVDAAEGFAQQQRLASIFARLPEADARILTLIGLDELSITEVATVLQVNVVTARQRLARARRRARDAGGQIPEGISRVEVTGNGDL